MPTWQPLPPQLPQPAPTVKTAAPTRPTREAATPPQLEQINHFAECVSIIFFFLSLSLLWPLVSRFLHFIRYIVLVKNLFKSLTSTYTQISHAFFRPRLTAFFSLLLIISASTFSQQLAFCALIAQIRRTSYLQVFEPMDYLETSRTFKTRGHFSW